MIRLNRLAFAVALLSGAAISVPAQSDGRRDAYAYAPCCGSEYNWSGFYVGGHAGAAYAQLEWTFPATIDFFEESVTRFAGGGQAGVQLQWERIVFGAEVSYTWADIDIGSATVAAPGTFLSANVKNLMLVTGRLGYAYDRWLAYARAGWASADVDFRSTGLVVGASSERENGWTAGIGIDMAITPRISVGVAYDYVHLDVADRTATGLVGAHVTDAAIDVQTFMARLNFRFGRDEPVAVK